MPSGVLLEWRAFVKKETGIKVITLGDKIIIEAVV